MKRFLESEVMDDFEEAKAYDRIITHEQGRIIDACFVESLLNMGVAEGRVLDIGTGPGRIAIGVADRCFDLEVTAIDLSESMLDIAEKNRQDAGVSVDFQVGDAKELPFPDNYFDLVYSHVTFHHLEDKDVVKAFKEAYRVVKPEGAMLIRDLKRPGNWLSLQFYVDVLGAPYDKLEKKLYKESLMAGFSKTEFEAFAREAEIDDFNIKNYFITHVGIEKFARDYKSPNLNYELALSSPKDGREKIMQKKLITYPGSFPDGGRLDRLV